MIITKLKLHDKLPLTCTRTGTCCHGKQVFLNPYELASLAQEKKLSSRVFRDTYCEFGGMRLRFDGKADDKGYLACSQYIENFGCSVHAGRPLACRLFPLGRQIQHDEAEYMYQGTTFPCLDGCPEVTKLQHLSVEDYLKGQLTVSFEKAQDEYLEVMQNIADIAFTLLLDTGLSETGEINTLASWRELGKLSETELANRIGANWIDILMLPTLNEHLNEPIFFAQTHNEELQSLAQENFGNLTSMEELHDAAVLMMALALYLARALGANPQALSEHWIDIAKENGAVE